MVGDHLHDLQCGKDAGSGKHSYSNTVERCYTLRHQGACHCVCIKRTVRKKRPGTDTFFIMILRYNRAVIEAESQGSEACVFK